MGALSDLYACFFRDGLCVVEGMPTTPEETSGHHYALRERLLGKDWAGWTASKPFWASINNRTPSLLQRQTCGARFILHVFEGPADAGCT